MRGLAGNTENRQTYLDQVTGLDGFSQKVDSTGESDLRLPVWRMMSVRAAAQATVWISKSTLQKKSLGYQ